MSKPSMGFSALNSIEPDKDELLPVTPRKQADLDRVAEKAGFKSRESVERLVKRPTTTEPTANLSMRPPLSVYNRFTAFALANNLSNPEALRTLLDRAGVK